MLRAGHDPAGCDIFRDDSGLIAAHGVVGASKILPVTFLVIAVTVAVYGLSAAPVAGAVGVLSRPRARTLLVGGAPWVVQLGCALKSAGLDVLVWAGHEQDRRASGRRAGDQDRPAGAAAR